ncbi:MAG: hypothetical protein IKL81_03725, partial [Clostridia bacterium]|nr:hypothetical protein [Clostridia bacterium]
MQENDGGIVKSKNPHKTIPQSAKNFAVLNSYADSSPIYAVNFYTREPLAQGHSTLRFYLFFAHRQSLYKKTTVI